MTATLDVLAEPETQPRRTSGRVRLLVWVLVLGLAGAAFGLAVGARLSAKADASVSVVLNPLPGNAFSAPTLGTVVDLETESQLPGSDLVIRRMAADGLSTPSADVVRRRLGVTVLPNTHVLVIHYRAETPPQALLMAKRIAKATLAERTARAQAAAAQRQSVLTDQLAEVAAQVGQVTKVPEGAERDQALALLSQQQAALQKQMGVAAASVSSPGEIISSETHGDAMLKKARLGIVVGFALLGMLVGAWVGRPARRRS